MSSVQPLLDAAGRRRSPATTPGAGTDQGTHRVAVIDDDREPHQGSPPPTSRPGGLKPAQRDHTVPHSGPAPSGPSARERHGPKPQV
jgi:hypothetical protein